MRPYRKARFRIDKGNNALLRAVVTALVIGAVFAGGGSAHADHPALLARVCTDNAALPFGTGEDLRVTGACHVNGGTYKYHNVNIIAQGKLVFDETTSNQKTDFYAQAILVENGGSLIAGSLSQFGHAPFGRFGGVLTFHLYGEAPDPKDTSGHGITCQSPVTDAFPVCGIPKDVWESNKADTPNPPTCTAKDLPGDVHDCFYQYVAPRFDDLETPNGFFGDKVLAVSYGGTLQLFGRKGAVYSGEDPSCELKVQGSPLDPSCSGESWVRLDTGTLVPAKTNKLTLSRAVKTWQATQLTQRGDQIVVTTTDYLPGHSEQCTIASITDGGKTITVTDCVSPDNPTPTPFLKYPHNGKEFDLSSRIPSVRATKPAGLTDLKFAETRAAVALLSRSIRIVSEGDTLKDAFENKPGSYFGGHTIVRQGFQSFQVQGVEFFQLGQGGRLGHYPVHFHLARQTPANTFVKDSAVWDSMTRWYVLHATQGVTLARNVGYLSTGHGYYLQDGTETDNKLYSNIGILARAAVANVQNPRRVPGILASPDDPSADKFPFHSDYNHPSVFWIMNGWNDFEYNLAAGAGTCGACYWLVPGANSGESVNMKWDSYAAEQKFNPFPDQKPEPPLLARAAMTPLEEFLGNSCTAAMNSFQVNGNTSPCFGVDPIDDANHLPPVSNPLAPASNPKDVKQTYYPHVSDSGGRFATRCPANQDCSTVNRCTDGTHGEEDNCDATVLDRYTTSFNWAEKNLAAIWLRPQWSLVINSVITDVQNAGLTFVTGGGYSKADVITGYWGLARKDVFIGSTQPSNPFASNAGPFNPNSGLQCAGDPHSFCLSRDEGISIPLTTFSDNQRFFSVYDGPSYQDSNAFLDIHPTNLTLDTPPNNFTKCSPNPTNGSPCDNSGWMNASLFGMRQYGNGNCYLPNAAIAWKQSNGFYYAPAFHSTNLFFDQVDIRHFVIEPLFNPGTFVTNLGEAKKQYCVWNDKMFEGFTDIDRQTVLNDDDGSLTGLLSESGTPPPTETISVNEDPFFNAPVETTECASDLAANPTSDSKLPPATARTSPYEYVTTVVYPKCGVDNSCGIDWGRACTTTSSTVPLINLNGPRAPACYGVPLYRQLLTAQEVKDKAIPNIRMMGQANFQRSSLTVNHGSYYIDTTVSRNQQEASGAGQLNVFGAHQPYYVFFVYAKPTTRQTYTLFVGKDDKYDKTANVLMGHANINSGIVTFTPDPRGWPIKWVRDYDPKTGWLTVTVTMQSTFDKPNDKQSLADEFDLTRNNLGKTLCKPSTICAWNDTNEDCECSITDTNNYLYDLCHETNKEGEDAICSWSVKDLDCPAAGCIGFQVTFADSFEINPTPPRPAAVPFASDPNFNWLVPFDMVAEEISGAECHYP